MLPLQYFAMTAANRKEPEATATLNQASIRQQLGVTHRTVADCEKVPLHKILVRAIPDISYGNSQSPFLRKLILNTQTSRGRGCPDRTVRCTRETAVAHTSGIAVDQLGGLLGRNSGTAA